MSLILEIQEIVSGPIKDLFLEITGPLFQLPPAPQLPPVDVQVGPETGGDVNFGSSFGDQNFGSSFGDFAPELGSSNGDQNISGLSLPSIPGSAG